MQYLTSSSNTATNRNYQTFVDWLRSAKANSTGHDNSKYHFAYPIGHQVTPEAKSRLRHSRLCKAAISCMFNIGDKAWRTITGCASDSAVVPAHGNAGKPNGRKLKDNNPIVIALKNFMEDLAKKGEPRAGWRDVHT